MCEDGWRETMVGTIGFYDKSGILSANSRRGGKPLY
jgi:hypothetical protein